jgi:hypothetical protein
MKDLKEGRGIWDRINKIYGITEKILTGGT